MTPQMEYQVIISIVFIMVCFVFAKIIRVIINKKVEDINDKHYFRRWVYYAMSVLSIIGLVIIWVDTPKSLSTVLGIGSAGLALALQPVIIGIAGWIFIIIKKPYSVGDRVEINGIIGDVIDIKMFNTVMLEVGNWIASNQSTGRIVHVPNGKIFTTPAYNYTSGFKGIWNELNFLITFESNEVLAEEIIINIAKEAMDKTLIKKIESDQYKLRKKYAIKPGKLTPITYFTIEKSGIQIDLRYLSDPRNQRYIKDLISRKVYQAFSKEEAIEFAYPTQRIQLNKSRL